MFPGFNDLVEWNCVFFVVAGSALGQYVQKKLAQEDLWKGSFGRIKEGLRSGLSICERWLQACATLTTQFWKRYGSHPWKGEKFVPQNLSEFMNRIEEVTHDLGCSEKWKKFNQQTVWGLLPIWQPCFWLMFIGSYMCM